MEYNLKIWFQNTDSHILRGEKHYTERGELIRKLLPDKC